jgi:hypothetical protein
MLEFLFELLAEGLLQFIVEVFVELFSQGRSRKNRPKASPYWLAFGYLALGLALGGATLLVFPNHFVHNIALRAVTLAVVPLTVGGMMALIGAWRAKRGDPVVALDRFMYGFLFALAH